MASIKILFGGEQVKVYRLDKSEVCVGRDETCEVHFGRPKRMEPGSMTSNGDSSVASASRRFLSEESVRSSKPVPTLAA